MQAIERKGFSARVALGLRPVREIYKVPAGACQRVRRLPPCLEPHNRRLSFFLPKLRRLRRPLRLTKGKLLRQDCSHQLVCILSDFNGERMCFLVVVGRSGRSTINSRFGEINSRLGRREFPISFATGIHQQGLDLPTVFAANWEVSRGKSQKIPSRREKSGNSFPPWRVCVGVGCRLMARRCGLPTT